MILVDSLSISSPTLLIRDNRYVDRVQHVRYGTLALRHDTPATDGDILARLVLVSRMRQTNPINRAEAVFREYPRHWPVRLEYGNVIVVVRVATRAILLMSGHLLDADLLLSIRNSDPQIAYCRLDGCRIDGARGHKVATTVVVPRIGGVKFD